MATETPSELGTSSPSPATWTEVYAVPDVAGNYAVTSLVTVCNLGTSLDYFHLAVVTHSAGTPTNQQYKAYNVPVLPGVPYLLRIALTPGRNKAITAYAKKGLLAFSVQGVQNV